MVQKHEQQPKLSGGSRIRYRENSSHWFTFDRLGLSCRSRHSCAERVYDWLSLHPLVKVARASAVNKCFDPRTNLANILR